MINHKNHKQQMLHKAFNAIYGLISPAIPHNQACQMWEYMELLFDEIETQVMDMHEPKHYQAIIYDILKRFKSSFDEALAFDIPLSDVLYDEIIRGWLS